jgi:hypothetical protein
MMQSAQINRREGGTIFGFPLKGFGLFAGLLLAVASAFFTFFATTCLAIFALLAWSVFDKHALSYAADTYLYVGAPAGVLVLVVAAPFFLTLWVRGKVRE